jgi:hypothetical protein
VVWASLRPAASAVGAVQMVELLMPLHTLIELEPRPDGTMVERRYKINIDSVSEEDVRCLACVLFIFLCSPT